MTRLKFLVFSVLVLGLWLYQLGMGAPEAAHMALESASEKTVGVPAALALRLEASRSEVQGAALKLAQSPALLLGAKPAKVEPPTAERLSALRAALLDGQTDAFKAVAVVGVANEAGALMALGAADPAAPDERFDLKQAVGAGALGALVDVAGVPHFFASLPLSVQDKAEWKGAGALFVGAPLLRAPQSTVEAVAKELALSVALFADGKLIAQAPAGDKPRFERAFKALERGRSGPTEKGGALALGPLSLPLNTQDGQPTLEVGARKDVPGTPYEVIATVSVRPAMQRLAESQKLSIFMFGGLLLLAIGFTIIMGGEAPQEQPVRSGAAAPSSPPASVSPRLSRNEALPLADAPPAPEAEPEDFSFGSAKTRAPPPPPVAGPANGATGPAPMFEGEPAGASTMQAPAYAPFESPPPFGEPTSDPFSMAAPPPAPVPSRPATPVSRPPVAAPSRALPPPSFDDDEPQRTVAYNTRGIPSGGPAEEDPFARAAAQGFDAPPPSLGDDFNPEATRVATVPKELLLKAQRSSTGENTTGAAPKLSMPLPSVSPVAPAVASAVDPEDQHFREIFRDFLAMRDKCGEPQDGLTWDKFNAKLRKNKEQLVAKYNCRTVRFQVYAKDGKAALKASPVKD